MKRTKICDISFWNGKIDWDAVVEDEVSAIIAKSSEANFIDTKFISYWNDAKSVGLPRSSYHFYREWLSGTVQAQFVVDLLDKYGWGEWNHWLDFEIPTSKAPAINLAQGVHDYFYEFERLTNLRPEVVFKNLGLYTSPGYWQPLQRYTSWINNRLLWCATYPWDNDKNFIQDYSIYYNSIYTDYPISTVKPWAKPFLFQWSGRGVVQGINSSVDMNVYDGNEEEFYTAINFKQINPIPPVPVPPVPKIIEIARTTAWLGLRIRDIPDLSGNRIGSLPLNTIVNIYEITNKWARIDPIEQKWCSIQYLEEV